MLSRRLSRPLARPSSAAWASVRALHATPCHRKVHEIKSTETFWSTVKGKPKVIVDCSAAWCGPCRTIAPVLEKLSEEPRFKDKVQFVKFDVDDLSEVAQQLHVRAMPTFVAFRDGDRDGEVVGADPSRLTELVKKLTEA